MLRAPVGGEELGTEGDAFTVVFTDARAAVAFAADAQASLAAHPWPEQGQIRVRMGMHTGEAAVTASGWVGLAIHEAARVCSAAHGGQVLVTEATMAAAGAALVGYAFADLGRHRLKDLAAPLRLFQLDVFRDGREFPPIRTLDRVRHNLPAALTTFVGQTGLIDELHVLLAEHRMLTLTGPGGVGKTRVALELGHACVSEYDDGVWLIDLSAVTDPEAVDDMTAAGLGLQEEPDRSLRDTLVDHLRDRRVLIIFDNCEHVIAAAATMADAVVHAGPNVRVVATSREPLGVDGERTVGIEPLPVPDRDDGPLSPDALAQVAAVQLFVDRARLTLSSFTLTDDNTPAVVEICHQLDGIPLALELAAARIKILSPSQILERLDDRFRLLTGGLRTALPRQQTLKALIDWSYDLLDEDEQRLLCDLAVFAGGCTVEAVAAITANDDEFVRAALAARERAGTVVRVSSRGELDTLLAGVIATAGARSVEAGRAVPLDVAVGDAVELAGALAARGPRDASYA